MITFSNIHLNFSHQTVFEGISSQVGVKDRVAIVGANGKGKSTLLKMLIGQVLPDKGTIHKAKEIEIGYLPQDFSADPGPLSVIDETMKAFESVLELAKKITEMEKQIEEYSHSGHPDLDDLLNHYGHLVSKYELADGFKAKSKAEEILLGLGFRVKELDQPVRNFSGGWRMRIALAKLLLSEPDYLFLDEPTNHLDLESVEWLEAYLKNYDGALVMISHDRYFLDNLVKRVLEIEFGKLTEYSGNYSAYEEEKAKREEILRAQYANQQAKLAQLNRFVERFRYKASKAKQVQSRVKLMDKIEMIDLGSKEKSIKFGFPPPPRSGRIVVDVKDLKKSFGDKLLFDNANFVIERGEKIALAGLNGSGKSTLIKMFLGRQPADSGELRIGSNVTIGYYAQHQLDELNPDNEIYEEVLNEAPAALRPHVRTLLGSFLFEGDDVFKRIHVLSGGEKARVALAKLLIKSNNLLIMDEPTNHLDMESKDILIDALQDFEGTIIIISHDRYFLDQVTNKVLYIHNKEIKEYLDTYSSFYETIWKNREDHLKKSIAQEKADKKAANQAENKQTSGPKSKEQKRLEAEARSKKSPEPVKHNSSHGHSNSKPQAQKHDAKKELAEVEKLVESKEKTMKELENKIADPNFYKNNPKEATAKMNEYEVVKKELQVLYKKWEVLTEQVG